MYKLILFILIFRKVLLFYYFSMNFYYLTKNKIFHFCLRHFTAFSIRKHFTIKLYCLYNLDVSEKNIYICTNVVDFLLLCSITHQKGHMIFFRDIHSTHFTHCFHTKYVYRHLKLSGAERFFYMHRTIINETQQLRVKKAVNSHIKRNIFRPLNWPLIDLNQLYDNFHVFCFHSSNFFCNAFEKYFIHV